ncbi:MAG: ABC transporter ATP-binding protein [Oscillospiraceae bacterium]|nr:ABC transporter ATP-binding protein [Oscillospiraceae bacterium]
MIQASNLTKRFDGFTALNEISCTIADGCIYGLVGSNGAGKSTLIRLMTGVYKADGGSVAIDGEPIFDNEATKRQIAYVPDELYFLPGASIKRMSELYGAVYPDFDAKRCAELTASFGLPYTRSAGTFSKGMRRQAATILALCTKPKYIFFDETFDGLDPVMRNLVRGLVCQDVADRNATAIITSHSLRELEDTCDQLALLHKGGMVLESDVTNLKTSLFKVQIAFSGEYDREKFAGIDLMHFAKRGSVTNMIVRGDRDETVWRLQAMQPLLMDILPLTLEEVFTYEMEALGYVFDDILNDAPTGARSEGGAAV